MNISCLRYPVIIRTLAVSVLCQLAACSTEDDLTGVSFVPLTFTGICSWQAPLAREDGTPLKLTDLGGYRLYYGTVEGVYPNMLDIDCDTGALDGSLPTAHGTYYYVVTAYDLDGLESTYSATVTATL